MTDGSRSLWAQVERSPFARRRAALFVVITVAHVLGAAAARDVRLLRALPLRLALRDGALDVTLAGRSIGTLPFVDLFV